MIKRYKIALDIIGGIPEEIPVLVDSGFQGVQKQYVNIRLPQKKPKGGKLTSLQTQNNRELAQERVMSENAFSGVKRYNPVSEIYRNRVSEFDDRLILTACGLWNFYLMAA
ncbi:MAG: transposase family protein [Xenococcaceae cyanobacterium]